MRYSASPISVNPHFSQKARLRIAETLPDKDLSPFIHPQLHRTVCCAFKPLNNHFSQPNQKRQIDAHIFGIGL
jgi:hypothetical protein